MLEPYGLKLRLIGMRSIEVIDSELRLLALIRTVCRQYGGCLPSIGRVDELLDERLTSERAVSRVNEARDHR